MLKHRQALLDALFYLPAQVAKDPPRQLSPEKIATQAFPRFAKLLDRYFTDDLSYFPIFKPERAMEACEAICAAFKGHELTQVYRQRVHAAAHAYEEASRTSPQLVAPSSLEGALRQIQNTLHTTRADDLTDPTFLGPTLERHLYQEGLNSRNPRKALALPLALHIVLSDKKASQPHTHRTANARALVCVYAVYVAQQLRDAAEQDRWRKGLKDACHMLDDGRDRAFFQFRLELNTASRTGNPAHYISLYERFPKPPLHPGYPSTGGAMESNMASACLDLGLSRTARLPRLPYRTAEWFADAAIESDGDSLFSVFPRSKKAILNARDGDFDAAFAQVERVNIRSPFISAHASLAMAEISALKFRAKGDKADQTACGSHLALADDAARRATIDITGTYARIDNICSPPHTLSYQ